MEKKDKKVKSTLSSMILAMVIVSGVAALVLGYVYGITQEPIQKIKDNKELEAIAEVVFGEFDNNPFEEKTEITTTDGKDKLVLYPARNGVNISSVAIKTYTNNGFGGKIELIVGFFLDGTINAYKVIDHKETPGLGTKIMEPKFASQFKGMSPDNELFRVGQDGGEIDAVTGATISSRAVIDAINRAYGAYRKFRTGN